MAALPTILLCAALASVGNPTLIEFHAPGCQHCRTMDATVRRLQNSGYSVQRVDALQHREVATQFGVTGTPTYVVVVQGQVVQKIEGATSYDRLVQLIESAQTNPAAPAAPSATPAPGTAPARPPASPRVPASPPVPGAGAMAAPTPEAVPPVAPPAALPPAAAPPPAAGRATAEVARSSEAAVQRALQATVRLRIQDETGTSVATGTIIDLHRDEALVLTCGHVFRSSRGKGEIQVDLFVPGAGEPLVGQLVDFDFYRDIALVSFRPELPVQPVPVSAADPPLDVQSTVFSIGCDNGGQPRIERSRVTRLNRYTGPPNVEVSGTPAGGRSGGGLFTADGRLVGVCNAANEPENEGIFASLATVHWQLEQVGLARLIPAARSTAEQVARDHQGPAVGGANDDQEIFFVVRSKSAPQDPGRAFVIDRPQPELLDALTRSGRPASGLPGAPPAGLDPNGAVANRPPAGPAPPGAAPATPPPFPGAPAPAGPPPTDGMARQLDPRGVRGRLPEASPPVMRGQQPSGGWWPFRP